MTKLTEEEIDRVRVLLDIQGRAGIVFKTFPYLAEYMTLSLCPGMQTTGDMSPYGTSGRNGKTAVVALSGCSMADVRRGDTCFLDNGERIEVIQ